MPMGNVPQDPLGEEWMDRRGPESSMSSEDRMEYERDYGRVVHSSAFRRLQGKTQVLATGEGGIFRIRLTHSMTAAQIGRGLLISLKSRYKDDENRIAALPTRELLETICLAHDLGHPPFGHSGETAANYAMRDFGGFEGNGQTLRIITRLERYIPDFGLNLTRRATLGLIKYPATYSEIARLEPPATNPPPGTPGGASWKAWHPPKCIFDEEMEVLEWGLKPLPVGDQIALRSGRKRARTSEEHGETAIQSLDASIMTLADDIAYGTHDVDDGISYKFVKESDLIPVWKKVSKNYGDWLARWNIADPVGSLMDRQLRRRTMGGIINALVRSTELEPTGLSHPLVAYRAVLEPGAQELLKCLKDVAKSQIIRAENVVMAEHRGRKLLLGIFDALLGDCHLVPLDHRAKKGSEKIKIARAACDFIAGMTDEYASRVYERLYIPHAGSLFDPL